MIKNKKASNTYNKTTIIFGYILFALTVLSFLVSTAIPFSLSLSYPTARHFNIIVMIIAFGVAAILPALASYFIGDKSTHSKNKTLHHYNGVLFGIAAYWVMQLFDLIGLSSIFGVNELPFPTPLVFVNVIPAILAIILMSIVAVAYTKKRNNKASILQYRPFQIVLIAGVAGPFLYSVSLNQNVSVSSLAASIGFLAIPVVIIAIAYKILAKYNATQLARLSDAIIAMSMGWIATWLPDSLITFLRLPYQVASIASYMVGLVVFVAYLYLRTRKP
jgi:hypothetical protein